MKRRMDRPSLCHEHNERRRNAWRAGADPYGEEDGSTLTMGIILSVQALSIKFDNRSVIQNLKFDVDAGDNVAIIGPNGAGKAAMVISGRKA